MTEFKVGDKVEVVQGHLLATHEIKQGETAYVLKIDSPATDSYPVYLAVDDREDYAPAEALKLVRSAEEPKVATPIDLPTVKFIYQQWSTIVDSAEGMTDETAACVFSGYISGLLQGLQGDFDG